MPRYARLKELGLPLIREPGERISRGYADLGYEEFLLISEQRMVSLFSGQVSTLPVDHERFFFAVPTVDQMLREVERRGAEIGSIENRDGRSWVVHAILQAQELRSVGVSMEEAVVDMLHQILERESGE